MPDARCQMPDASEASRVLVSGSEPASDLNSGTLYVMSTILLVTDNDRVIDSIHSALTDPGTKIIDERDPSQAATVAYSEEVDAILVDMRVGSMGAIAVTHAVRNAAIDVDPIPVTILLDREVDAFLAQRARAAHWVMKTAPASDLRQSVTVAGSDT
jgi:CheY-like chemotaxis protein